MRTYIANVACVLFSASIANAQLYPTVYWTDRQADTIRRIDGDGRNHQVLVSGLGEPRGLAVDFENEFLYWADNGTNLIQRSNLDGSNIVTLVDTGLNFPADIELDVAAGKMYWADALTKKIQRANLDGSNVEDLVTGLGNPYFMELDLDNGHVYWTDYGTDKVQRSDLDGGNVVDLVTTGLVLPRGITLDIEGNQMYWADRGTDQIQRSQLDGSMIETIHTINPPAGVDAAPHGVALDLRNNHVYWLDNGTVKIQRSEPDGSNVVDLVTDADGILAKPWDLQLDYNYKFVCVAPRLCAGAANVQTIDQLSSLLRSDTFDPRYDYDVNQTLDARDKELLVHRVLDTSFGDANLDGVFNSTDFVQIFMAGEYRDAIAANSTWSTGDWTGDGEFDSDDLVLALTDGQYQAAAVGLIVVPEPAGIASPLFIVFFAFGFARQRLLPRRHAA